jgi:hypothetical protein
MGGGEGRTIFDRTLESSKPNNPTQERQQPNTRKTTTQHKKDNNPTTQHKTDRHQDDHTVSLLAASVKHRTGPAVKKKPNIPLMCPPHTSWPAALASFRMLRREERREGGREGGREGWE